MKRLLGLSLILCLISVSTTAVGAPDTLEKIKRTGAITIAYSPSALPFSFRDEAGKPAGYSVDMCRRIVAGLQAKLKVSALKTRWVAANTPGRLKAIADGQADIDCGTTTVTLSRQEMVGFSNFIFVELGGVMVKSDAGIDRLTHLDDRKIAVVPGTTTERRLRRALLGQLVKADFVAIEEADEGMKLLDKGKVDAFAGDRLVLMGQAAAS
ncbi:MAG: transporter substrate-binding domain-containing protein, partial [Gammaproteobacteria bacterium]|nr:transporter substrate-binding domain-containing protein [Gammaproteobacteria bacterium]